MRIKDMNVGDAVECPKCKEPGILTKQMKSRTTRICLSCQKEKASLDYQRKKENIIRARGRTPDDNNWRLFNSMPTSNVMMAGRGL